MKTTTKTMMRLGVVGLAVLGAFATMKALQPRVEKDCVFKGVHYKANQVVPCAPGNECNTCWCEADGNVATTLKFCLPPMPDPPPPPSDAGQPDREPVAAAGGANAKPSGIAVSLSVREEIVEGQLRVLVSFEFKNESKRRQRIRRSLVSDPAHHAFAHLRVSVVDKDDYGLFYTGPFECSRPPLPPSAFVTLKPGESRRIPDLDFTDRYCWPDSAQKLTVWFETQTLLRDEDEMLRAGPVEFDYRPVARRPCPVPERKKRGKLVRPAKQP